MKGRNNYLAVITEIGVGRRECRPTNRWYTDGHTDLQAGGTREGYRQIDRKTRWTDR